MNRQLQTWMDFKATLFFYVQVYYEFEWKKFEIKRTIIYFNLMLLEVCMVRLEGFLNPTRPCWGQVEKFPTQPNLSHV